MANIVNKNMHYRPLGFLYNFCHQ